MKRRNFLQYSIVASTLLLPTFSLSKETTAPSIQKTTVAICGGGFGGLSAAKLLKELNPNLDVTVIEQRKFFISCPMSNGYLGEVKDISFEDLTFDYNSAITKYKYNFLNETITDINIAKKIITTQTTTLEYDYMIMATGVDYNYKKLFKRDKQKAKEALLKAPPGLKPGNEQLALKRMIENFKGGNFVLTIPSAQFKCPSAPYERACMIANYFKKNHIKGKVIILDPRVKPAAKPEMFQKAYRQYYSNIIEYRNLTNFKDVDFKTKLITTEKFDKKTMDYITEELPFTEASIIPPNKANKLLKKAKLKTYVQGFAKLKKPTFRSVSHDDVYIIGDAQGEYPYPKSAQMANSQAYLVAEELTLRLKNKPFNYKENMPGNICYSLITEHKAASITHSYVYNEKVETSYVVSNINKATKEAGLTWYKALTNDIFGL